MDSMLPSAFKRVRSALLSAFGTDHPSAEARLRNPYPPGSRGFPNALTPYKGIRMSVGYSGAKRVRV